LKASCYKNAGIGGVVAPADALTTTATVTAPMAETAIPHSRPPRNDLCAAYPRAIINYDPATGESGHE
jgi:hypothetical protein